MEKEEFVQRFKEVSDFFGLAPDEYQALKVVCLGNKDAAETFILMISDRVRQDPRFLINDMIRDSISIEREAGLTKKFRT